MPSKVRKYVVSYYSVQPKGKMAFTVTARTWQDAMKYAEAKLPNDRQWFLESAPETAFRQ